MNIPNDYITVTGLGGVTYYVDYKCIIDVTSRKVYSYYNVYQPNAVTYGAAIAQSAQLNSGNYLGTQGTPQGGMSTMGTSGTITSISGSTITLKLPYIISGSEESPPYNLDLLTSPGEVADLIDQKIKNRFYTAKLEDLLK